MNAPLPMRDGAVTVAELIHYYMADYAGRDTSRVQRLSWWAGQVGNLTLGEISDDHLHAALEHLASSPPRYFAGKDADGRPIMKAKRCTLAPATLNRYSAAIAAVFTWGVRRRIAPKGWIHPCRGLERPTENNEKTRFLTKDERARLLAACKASKWPRLYLLVLMALTTGARKGELMGLRWADIDLEHAVANVGRTKNGDAKTLPLVPAAVEQLAEFKGAPAALVFPSPAIPSQPFAYETRWQQALKAAHIRGFRFHDLRHTAASHLAQNGATLLEIADLLGHRQMSMTKRYSHLASGHRSALVNRVMGDLR
ncbi:MAG: site-specific integrase [Betaproteobacteria bacterium]|nr:site-specific integrase [Betaproteobacteria bacterium]